MSECRREKNIDKFRTNFAIGIYKQSNICYNAENKEMRADSNTLSVGILYSIQTSGGADNVYYTKSS